MQKKARILSLVCLILLVAITVQAASQIEGKLVPKVDNFIVLVDLSGSMFLTKQGKVPAKAKLVKDLLAAINRGIPELGYVGAIQTFPPSKTVIGPQRYTRYTFENGIQSLPEKGKIFGNQTPLGKGILGLDPVLRDMPPGKTAIVIFSDGEENLDVEALKAQKRLMVQYPDISFHTVSFADEAGARVTLEELSRGSDGISVEGSALLADGVVLDQFVEDVFYRVEVPVDSDGDGVVDEMDKCPDTPTGVSVDARGCPVDSDGDGVPDYLDRCPATPSGVAVNSSGCPVDSDGDGVPDYLDRCPDTPKGATVNEVGCWALRATALFDTNSSYIMGAAYTLLDEVVTILQENPEMKLEIQGHADNTGTPEYNLWLSEKRASRVMDYLVSKGIDPDRLTAKGYGSTQPVVSNDTKEGRARNRRVELKRVFE
jgi:OOP family OmpA-OmpF porin